MAVTKGHLARASFLGNNQEIEKIDPLGWFDLISIIILNFHLTQLKKSG